MATFAPTLMTPYFAGMGLGALYTSVVSLVQGEHGGIVVKNETSGTASMQCVNVTQSDNTTVMQPQYSSPLFTVEVYYIIMFIWLLFTCIAYFLLVHRTHRNVTPLTTQLEGSEKDRISLGMKAFTFLCLANMWVCALQV
jgi:hypothetical protein